MSNVTHPSHYNTGKIEVIEFIEDQRLNFTRGNAVKYICRAGRKDPGKECEDLAKAIWYLQRDLETLQAAAEGRAPKRPNDMNQRATSATAASNSSPPERPADTALSATSVEVAALPEYCADDDHAWYRAECLRCGLRRGKRK